MGKDGWQKRPLQAGCQPIIWLKMGSFTPSCPFCSNSVIQLRTHEQIDSSHRGCRLACCLAPTFGSCTTQWFASQLGYQLPSSVESPRKCWRSLSAATTSWHGSSTRSNPTASCRSRTAPSRLRFNDWGTCSPVQYSSAISPTASFSSSHGAPEASELGIRSCRNQRRIVDAWRGNGVERICVHLHSQPAGPRWLLLRTGANASEARQRALPFAVPQQLLICGSYALWLRATNPLPANVFRGGTPTCR